MDEKGFFVGITARSKRVFSKAIWLQQLRTAAIQDGNREWITLVACVCGDGTSLPPMLIYEGKAGIQSSWVDALDEDLHRAFVTNSPTGWSNNELGLAWLTEVFERYTHEKARRQWRLLILDGHGSHLTREFIEYCDSKKILLAVYPPHSTHTLQPLDVVMFSPLAKAYSQELDRHLHRSQGLIAVKKRDFFPIFWPAWSYTMRPELILQSFRATGVWPMDAQVILDRFNTPPSEQAIHPGLREVGDGDTWRDIRKILDAAVTERAKVEGNRVGTALHSLQAQNELLHHENDGLHEALLTKQRHKKKNSLLGLEDGSGALLFSPRKVQQARQQLLDKQHQEEEERLQKARRKEERAAAIARKKLEQEAAKARRKVEMERRKEEREAKAAQLAAARALKNQQREAATSQKSRDTPNKGKRKASQKAAPKTTKKRRVMGVRSGVDVASPLPEPPTKTS
ncbi:pogo transposable [Stemphylium lycopersici]|uniref:Pogo transposable n=1 Tax=Stemphylium lycopersici TaxID=183478 RepID=A0A364MRA0_STELY|nr:pogo transposable [Stemphylium lycopersici]RAQ99311.1 pogo transposable [Stemphylium lycopersici]